MQTKVIGPLADEGSALARKFASAPTLTFAPRTSDRELSEEELQGIDAAYHDKKTSGALQRERDHRALVAQVQHMHCVGAL